MKTSTINGKVLIPSSLWIYFSSTTLAILTLLTYSNTINPGYLAIFTPALLLTISIFKGSPVLTLTSLFISTYFLYLIPYFFLGIPYATRVNYQDIETSSKGLILLSLFTIVFITIASTGSGKSLDIKKRITRTNNSIIFYVGITVIAVLTTLMISDGNIFTSSYREITEDRKAFIDYTICLVLFCYLFGKTPTKEKILLLTIAFYIGTCLLFGYRLRAIQVILMTFILFYEKKYSNLQVITAYVLMLALMLAIGVIRTENKEVNLLSLIGFNDGTIISNQGGVFLNANMYIGLVDDKIIDTEIRIKTFLGNIISIVYPQSLLGPDYHLPKTAEKYFSIPGGGLISGYLYVWGGWFSVIFGAVLIGILYKKLLSTSINPILIVYGAIIVSTLPRWYAYSPIHFFKMGTITIVLYYILKITEKAIKKST